MKKLICLTLLLGLVSLGFAQKAKETSALQAMVDTERAFARMSEEQGIRPSFMTYIADDGILFRPTAVKGKQWMMEYPLPPSDKRPWLSWQPTFADIALVGDMGYTTGPWEYKADIHDAKPVAWGNFLTVWKRQPDRSWKFAIDLGISNPQPDQAATSWQLPNNYLQMSGGSTTDVKADTTALLKREREFSRDSATRGAQKAFDAYAADGVRVFRNGKLPFVGKADAAAALPANSIVWTWEPAFAEISRSGDLGYSYGTYQLTKNDATLKMTAKVETGNYYRIWKYQYSVLQGNTWKVVADLLDPLPLEKKN
jgi:ketosteroid isomerase-like protein